MVLLEYTNTLGIDPYYLSEFDHHNAKAQFICGLGSIKAKDFLRKIKDLGRPLRSRAEIQQLRWLPSKVEEMVLGFLKFKQRSIEMETHPLDTTRIHPFGSHITSAISILFYNYQPIDYNFTVSYCKKLATFQGIFIESDTDSEVINKVNLLHLSPQTPQTCSKVMQFTKKSGVPAYSKAKVIFPQSLT